MKKFPDPQLYIDVARELDAFSGITISPAFVEKDWFAIELLIHIEGFLRGNGHDFALVFTGGTSLSKAHNLIERFSEDLDFLATPTNSQMVSSRTQRRAFRTALAARINLDERFTVDLDATKASSRNNGNFFRCIVSYPRSFDHTSIREDIQLDVTFEASRSIAIPKQLTSFVASVTGDEQVAGMTCVDPLDIAADKLSALSWRVLTIGENALPVDTTFVRHLHDLAALIPIIDQDPQRFITSAETAWRTDSTKSSKRRILADGSQAILLERVLTLIIRPEYDEAYKHYVTSMSYAPDERSITYTAAVDALTRIVEMMAKE